MDDIMDEMFAASQEEGDGIEQVKQAGSQMHEVTRQNAALVQKAAAAASALEEQAARIESAIAALRLSGDET